MPLGGKSIGQSSQAGEKRRGDVDPPSAHSGKGRRFQQHPAAQPGGMEMYPLHAAQIAAQNSMVHRGMMPMQSGLGGPHMMDGVGAASWILGVWTGTGKAMFPHRGGEEFSYAEEATFVPVAGRPAIAYSQRMWRGGDQAITQSEHGFLRLGAMAGGPGRAQMVVSQVTGLSYVCEGEIGEYGMEVHSVQISNLVNSESGPVHMIKRRFFPRGDGALCYTVDQSSGGGAELVRVMEGSLLPMASMGMMVDPATGVPMAPGQHRPGAFSAYMGGMMGPELGVGLDMSGMAGLGMLGVGMKGREKDKRARVVPTPPRKDWGKVTSYPDGKLVVEVARDKFDGDSICVQCREKDNSWDRSGWVRCTFSDADSSKGNRAIQVTFDDREIGKEYEIRAKVSGGQPTTTKQGGTLIVRAGEDTVAGTTCLTEEAAGGDAEARTARAARVQGGAAGEEGGARPGEEGGARPGAAAGAAAGAAEFGEGVAGAEAQERPSPTASAGSGAAGAARGAKQEGGGEAPTP